MIEAKLNATNAWIGRVGADSLVEMIGKRGYKRLVTVVLDTAEKNAVRTFLETLLSSR